MRQELNINFHYKSENYDNRPPNCPIEAIILHYTEVNFEESIRLLTKKDYKVSAHYLISEDGIIYQLVNDTNRAWHAGISYWKGKERVNDFSLGIEIVNNGKDRYTDSQIDSLIELLKILKYKYAIKDNNILGHSDVAFDRKDDPGNHFPWSLLQSHGLGIYHNIKEDNIITIYKKGDKHQEIKKIKDMLNKIGYKIDLTEEYTDYMELLVRAFQKRYNQRNVSGILDNLTIKIISKILESVDV